VSADKTADAIKLNLRLPKPLHKRLKQQARRNNVSLNTEIVNQLEGQQPLFEKTVRSALQRAIQSFMEAPLDQEGPFKIWIEQTKPEQK
jgi:non-canonical (house-cleaning) NTP pyrophosphatase